MLLKVSSPRATAVARLAHRRPVHARARAHTGAMFRGASEAKGEREIICLHALEGDSAARLSMPIIKGVACTSSQVPMPHLAHPRANALADGQSTHAHSCVRLAVHRAGSLESDLARSLALNFARAADTTLEGAKALVAGGEAEQKDFWVFVGYAGWAPSQLQGEVERDSWFLASADSGTLLQELLTQGTELPPLAIEVHLAS